MLRFLCIHCKEYLNVQTVARDPNFWLFHSKVYFPYKYLKINTFVSDKINFVARRVGI